MAYTPTDWKDGAAGGTPITAAELNRMEQGIVDGQNAAPAWADVTGKPATFPPALGTTATTALAGNTALLKLGTTATTALKGDTVIPTLPGVATAAELEAGTVTAARLVSPKAIHDEIARQIAAIPAG